MGWYSEQTLKQKRKLQDQKNKRRRKLKQWYWNILKESPCVDCGETDYRCLDFDHVRGEKNRGVFEMVHACFSKPKILVEMAKCEVRCARCHRIKSFESVKRVIVNV